MPQDPLKDNDDELYEEPQDSEPAPDPNDPFYGLDEDDVLDVRTVRKMLNHTNNKAAQSQDSLNNLADVALTTIETASRMREPEVWNNYGGEIRQAIESLSQSKKLEPGDIDNIVNTVKGRHFDDIAQNDFQDRLKSYLSNLPPADVTPSVSAADSYNPRIDEPEIPEGYMKALETAFGSRDAGMAALRDSVAKRREWGEANLTLSEAIRQIATGGSIVDPFKGTISSQDLTDNNKKSNG